MTRASTATIRSPRRAAGPAKPASVSVPPILAPIVGRLAAVDESSRPHVDFPGNPMGRPIVARGTVPVVGHAGADALLVFDGGDPARPIVVGLMRDGLPIASPVSLEVSLNGRRIELAAVEQLTLRCGRASLTLTSAGKVLIRGAYVLSRSSGANRIKGGSVQIN